MGSMQPRLPAATGVRATHARASPKETAAIGQRVRDRAGRVLATYVICDVRSIRGLPALPRCLIVVGDSTHKTKPLTSQLAGPPASRAPIGWVSLSLSLSPRWVMSSLLVTGFPFPNRSRQGNRGSRGKAGGRAEAAEVDRSWIGARGEVSGCGVRWFCGEKKVKVIGVLLSTEKLHSR